MLATFIIGLREGLEAALIVGIIAAFLRRNGKSLAAMWVGVVLAVILSIAVGVGLDLVEQGLPQAGQEAMETVIGAIAVFFVTGMIAWMNAHARDLRRDLEAQAAAALSQTSSLALAVMAFLAVLKEGFETSVFLLATFSAAQSAALAATGALLGILLAVAIGWGIYAGGVKLHLGRFFRFTGAFLILVAAGLVISALRTAHEAGWLNAGQQMTVSLSWLVAPGTVQSALVTGVLGIPADPRLIEVLGWFAYLVPVALFIYWPQTHRPSSRGTIRLQAALTAGFLVLAGGLAIGIPVPRLHLPASAAIVGDTQSQTVGSARWNIGLGEGMPTLDLAFTGSKTMSLPLAESAARQDLHDNIPSRAWRFDRSLTPVHVPAMLTLEQVVDLAGGRIPIGLNPQQHPGPYRASWQTHRVMTAWAVKDALLDASGHDSTIVTLSGGGLETPRVLRIAAGSGSPSGGWRIAPAYHEKVVIALNTLAMAQTEWTFWAMQLPILLIIAAFILGIVALRNLVRLRRKPGPVHRYSVQSVSGGAAGAAQGATHAAD